MVSIVITILLSLIIIACMCLKFIDKKMTHGADKVICVIVPLVIFILLLIVCCERFARRRYDVKNLETLCGVIKYDIDANRVFSSEYDKSSCVDSLERLLNIVEQIAHEDTLVSIIVGSNDDIKLKIKIAKDALNEQIKRINRLNRIILMDYNYTDKKCESNSEMKLIEPVTSKLKTLNIGFKPVHLSEVPIVTYAEVFVDGELMFSQAYNYNEEINCFVLPNHWIGEKSFYIGYLAVEQNDTIFYNLKYNINE